MTAIVRWRNLSVTFRLGKINILYYRKKNSKKIIIRPDNIKTAAAASSSSADREERFLYFLFPGSLITSTADLICVAFAIRIYILLFSVYRRRVIIQLIIKQSSSSVAEETYIGGVRVL